MPTKNEADDEPKKHEEQKHADSRHGNQHRPALLFVEGEPRNRSDNSKIPSTASKTTSKRPGVGWNQRRLVATVDFGSVVSTR